MLIKEVGLGGDEACVVPGHALLRALQHWRGTVLGDAGRLGELVEEELELLLLEAVELELLEVPELEDPRFETVAGRALHKEEVLRLVGARLRRDSTEHWVARLEAAGVPCAPVNHVDQALRDPQALARGMVVQDPGYRHVAGPLPRLRSPHNRPAPRLGEHTDEVFREWCG